ncbi:hypothetical protein X772_16060 [Mesorhizobium sp. LSJC280B00]|nr:hypothetical protein X772_16060 [Mesorhizobium sp. LSJC280B00]
MESAMPFDKRQDSEGLWEVYDSESDEAVVVGGLPLSGLDESEADEAIEKLNRGDLTSDNIPETVRSGWPPTKDGL